MSSHPLFAPLAEWTAINAPVGFEEPVQQRVIQELQNVCDRVEADARGNVYGYQDGTDENGPTIMIGAHADEIGFMITCIREDGFLRFTSLGFPTEMVLPGQRVTVLTKQGEIPGVIGVPPGHILSSEESRRVPAEGDRYIDIGAESREQAVSWGVETGTPAVFFGPLTETPHPTRIFGKAIDNRAGILAILQAAKTTQSQKLPNHRVYVVTVEEEIGLRGALVAAQHVQPDVMIAVDTVPSGGPPDVSPEQLPWGIGGGPLLKVRESKGLSTQRPLRDLMRATAERFDIPYQLIVDTAGITDATTAQQATGQTAAMVLGIARRYSHAAIEMCDLSDLDHLIQLLVETVTAIESRDQLQRYDIS